MSSPQDLLRDGRLSDAVEAQVQAVKSRPTDLDERFRLFTLLCFQGELERAQVHLEALTHQAENVHPGAMVYHALLAADFEREKVFADAGHPGMLQMTEAGSARLDALVPLRKGDAAGVEAALERADDAGVEASGKLNGKAFESICDYDDLLGDFLEVYAGGRYLWVPFEEIRSLTVQEPETHLDALWLPAELVSKSGDLSHVHLPSVYPGTARTHDDALRLGRTTAWHPIAEERYRGVGQKVLFATQGDEVDEVPILEVRSIELADAETANGG